MRIQLIVSRKKDDVAIYNFPPSLFPFSFKYDTNTWKYILQRKRSSMWLRDLANTLFFTSPIPFTKQRPTASRTDVQQRARNGAKGRRKARGERRRVRIRRGGGATERERRRRWSHLQVDYHSEKKRGETSSWPENNWATSLRLTFDK